MSLREGFGVGFRVVVGDFPETGWGGWGRQRNRQVNAHAFVKTTL